MFNDLLYRLRALFRGKRMEAELDEEVRFHFEQQVGKNVREGMTEQEAVRQARLLFGGMDEVKEECRDARGIGFVEPTWQDLRYAARRLRKSPGFTVIAVLSLALGIGANTAIFSLVDAVLLRSLPVEKPDELELVRIVGSNSASTSTNFLVYKRVRELEDALDGAAARMATAAGIAANGQAVHGTIELVTGSYFPLLGVRPALGRLIGLADDETPGGHPLVVLSYRFWQDAYDRDPTVIGQVVRIRDHPHTVIGVAPPGFFGVEVGTSPDVWIPITQAESFAFFVQVDDMGRGVSLFDSAMVNWISIIVRRAPGVTREQAQAELTVAYQLLQEEVAARYERRNQRLQIELMPGAQGFSRVRGTFENPLFVLAVLVALVLGLACVNVANLLLGRYAARRNEIGVRLALGAGRVRLVRQLLAESVLLAAIGGAFGVLLAVWGIRLLLGFLPADSLPLYLLVAADGRALLFAASAAALAVLVFGLLPAWQAARPDVAASIRNGRGALSMSRFDLRKALVIAQVTLALLLVVGGGLFLQSLRAMSDVHLGVRTDDVLTAKIDPRQFGYTREQTDAFFREVGQRLRATPGIQAVGFTWQTLLETDFLREGDERTEQEDPGARAYTPNVGGDFFAATGMEIVRGRGFGPQDTANSEKVSIISETAARYYFPDEDPLGQPGPLLRTAGTIIGVVADARLGDVHEQPRSVLYSNAEQTGGLTIGQTLYIRTEGDAASYAQVLRRIVGELDSTLPLFDVKTFAAQKDEALARERLVATISGFFAVLSLLLAAIGIYGVVAYSVIARTREIGVRMSLGAERSDVLWTIQRGAMALTGAGIAIGIPLSLALYRLLESQLFGVEPNDMLTLACTAGILAAVAVAAAWIPARRAASIDPATVLRCDQ